MERTPVSDAGRHTRERLLADVSGGGVHVVRYGDEHPPYAHTVGLFENFLHPEVVVFGFDDAAASTLLRRVARRVAAGARFLDGYQEDFPERGRDSFFQPLPSFAYDEYLDVANWFYKSSGYPVLQYVWADRANSFPWEDEFDADLLDSAVFLDGEVSDQLVDWPWRPDGHTPDDVRVLYRPPEDAGPEEWVWARPVQSPAGALQVVDLPCFTALGCNDVLLDATPLGANAYLAERAERRGNATLMLELLEPGAEEPLVAALRPACTRRARFIADYLAVDITPGDEERLGRVLERWKDQINFLALARDD